jgi:isopenicillin N synthase-like dioxygenase
MAACSHLDARSSRSSRPRERLRVILCGVVPRIDLQPWRTGGPADRDAVARALDEACSDVGFFELVGHGIAAVDIEAMRAATARFFALPLADKLRFVPPQPDINRGYAPVASEALSHSLGVEAPAPDLFEAFNIGPDDVPDEPFYRNAPHHFFAPNTWPEQLPELRPALTAYFAAAVRVGFTLTDVFAAALGLADGWFRPFVNRSTLTMRVNHYESASGSARPLPGQMRMGAHTDYGIVTVLYVDASPGLQIMGPDGRFFDVVSHPGALLVNLGDLTARWTNDRWRSTLHRVVPPASDEGGPFTRRSVALFLDGNYDAVIDCVPTCCGPERPRRHAPVVAGEHLMAKFRAPRARGMAFRRPW